MEFDAEIHSLTVQFYKDYPREKFPEIALKKGRPYSCLLIEYMDDMFICVPFRSHVRHKYAYHFRNSVRSQQMESGLDYTKVVLIKNSAYIDGSHTAVVDQDEYKETMQHLERIVGEVYKYISDYKKYVNGEINLHPREVQRRYGCSTLPYFEKFLKNG